MARIDYCNGLFLVYHLYISVSYSVFRTLQRDLCYTPRHCHISPVLRALHWLPVRFRIQYKIVLITFKAIHNLALAYPRDLIKVKQKLRNNLRSNTGTVLQDPSAKLKHILANRSFTAAAPKTWNNLPNYIRKEDNFDKFKSLLNNHYFREAYSNLI